ncbi:hypothetical protein CPC08DRAFT_589300, partial [Agrocybe pediades]
DLPNELLLHILFIDGILSSNDLYNLSFLCQKLRSIALPIFLRTNGITDPERETNLYSVDWNPKRFRDPNTLNALNILPHFTSIQHFRCFFQDPDSKSPRNGFQEEFHLAHAVNRVSRLVQKLKRIEHAEIYLVWDEYFVSRQKSVPYVPMGEVKRWTDAFGYFLNLLLVRGCKTLTVQYDSTFEVPFQFKSKGAFSYLSKSSAAAIRGGEFLQWTFDRPLHNGKPILQEKIDPPLIPAIPNSMHCLTTLRIHSSVLLLPPFVNWTLSMLRDFPLLTSVSFAYIAFSSKIWATLLPLIGDVVSEKLTELAFYRGCPNLEPSDLLHFLSRLDNLELLSIDRSFRTRFRDFPNSHRLKWPGPPSFPLLPNLQRLTATVELVSYLLDVRPTIKGKTSYTALPRLTHLTVYPASRLIHPPDYIESTLAVNSLFDRAHSQLQGREVVFGLDAQMEFTDFESVTRWIEAIRRESQFRRMLTNGTGDSSNLSIAFPRVEHLVLFQLDEEMAGSQRQQQHARQFPTGPAMLCRWMNMLFPQLDCLTFTYQLAAIPSRGEEADMTGEMLEALKGALKDSCPNIRTLVV